MRKPVVGEKLFSLNVGNAARNCEQVLTPMWVASVGRKYFKMSKAEFCQGLWSQVQFRLSDWCENSDWQTHCLYETEQEFIDEKASHEICEMIKTGFEYGHNKQNVTLEDLRRIDSILIKYTS